MTLRRTPSIALSCIHKYGRVRFMGGRYDLRRPGGAAGGLGQASR